MFDITTTTTTNTTSCDVANNTSERCYACRSPSKKLIECNELESDMVPRRFCDQCLVNKEVPVYRRSLKIWSFGRVVSFCASNKKHTVEFLSGERETVDVGTSPFRSYQNGEVDDNNDNMNTDNTNTNVDANVEATEVIPFEEDEYNPRSERDRRPPSVQLFADDPLWNDVLQGLIMDGNDNDNNNDNVNVNADTTSTTATATATATTNITAHVIGSDSDESSNNDRISHSNTKKRRRPASAYEIRNGSPICHQPSQPQPQPQPQSPLPPSKSQQQQQQQQQRPQKRLKKSVPRPWGPREDEALVVAVRSSPSPVRWPLVAERLVGRTAKQCRERYVNQLDPSLKDSDEWSPAEDVFVFNLYHTFGAQWAKIASLMDGRTDNAVKNRFHHTRRKMEKETNKCHNDSKRRRATNNNNNNNNKQNKEGETIALARKLRAETEARKTSSPPTGFRKKVADAVGHAAAKCLLSSSEKKRNDDRFRTATPGERCRRCCLFLPSKQTGTRLCRRTNWCETCVDMPTYMCRDSLYDAVTLVAEHRHEFAERKK